MKQLAWFLKWALKAAIFFTLFAFALNNQHDATVRFFFGQQWTAPLVLVVLSAFALGLVIGVLGMVPRWWQHRRAAALARRQTTVTAATTATEKPPVPQQPPYGI
ncbi:MAG: LapA family protein [Pseudomonadota bacterium]